ncbi:MAG: hypothetical protein ACI8WB_003216, partial [Phenylobacterium sp.]
MTDPDYQQWSLSELVEGIKHIDSTLYPERKQEMECQI